MYAKFKIKVLNNSRLNLGRIENDVFPPNFFFEVQWMAIPNVKC